MRMRLWIIGAALGTLLVGQDTADRVTVPFRDASKPRSLTVHVMNGGMTVRGYDGKDAIVEANPRGGERRRNRTEVPPGMHQIGPMGAGLDIVEDNNAIKVTGGMSHSVDVVIQVPRETALNLTTLNGGKILVENITGEIVAENMNGSVEITNVSGTVVASSQNGKITVSLDKVTPNKSMSFVTMNGTVDVTLPADVKANLKMKTENGEIWSDFDVKLDASRAPVVEDRRKDGGRYHVRMDKSMYGSINGGGPEMTLQTYNGSILIHKK
jgi:hypothetical protein